MSQEQDRIVQQLFAKVQEKKNEISKIENPHYETNCSFAYDKNSANDRRNIKTVMEVDELVSMLAFLIDKNESYEKAAEILGVKSTFSWLGFTLEQWKSDFQLRINKINISKKKAELEDLEKRLDKLVSPELKAQLELAEIQKLLGD